MAGNRGKLFSKPPQYTPEQVAAAEEKLRLAKERSDKLTLEAYAIANETMQMLDALEKKVAGKDVTSHGQPQYSAPKSFK